MLKPVNLIETERNPTLGKYHNQWWMIDVNVILCYI